MDTSKTNNLLVGGLAATATVAACYYFTTQNKPTTTTPTTTPKETRYAIVEGGGTTFRVAIVVDNEIIEKKVIKTTTPPETLSACVSWLEERKPFKSIGMACFGPLDINPVSDTYGYITSTPKPGWQQIDIITPFKPLGVPIKFDTDVNAAAIAHQKFWTKSPPTCAYITVGTGVGVGLVVEGRAVHGMAHPEMGHLMVARMEGDDFPGVCPFHGGCIEGMVCSGAIAKRAGVEPKDLANLKDDDPVWPIVAYYLTQLCISIHYTVAPHFIVIGGGVLQRKCLFAMIREQFDKIVNGYLPHTGDLNEYLRESPFGENAGVHGGIAMAHLAAEEE